MFQSQNRWNYDALAQWLHWLTAALVIVLLVMGKAFEIETDEPGSAVFFWHSSLGVLVFALAATRIIWHFAGPPVAAAQGMSRMALMIARSMHAALYFLLFAVPLAGWLAASADNAPTTFFGIASLPVVHVPAVGKEGFEELHEVLGNVLLVLASLHVIAALKHHFIDHDEVLIRMLPGQAGAHAASDAAASGRRPSP